MELESFVIGLLVGLVVVLGWPKISEYLATMRSKE